MNWRLGVLGSPVAHSLTPRLHEAALSSLGLRGSSRIVEADLTDVASLPSILEQFDGLSVTMPLKSEMLRLCTVLDDRATRIGAVNSLLRTSNGVEGRSTDGVGFLDALQRDFQLDVAGHVVIVRGGGGAARSLVNALSDVGAASIVILTRSPERARSWAEGYRALLVNPASVTDVALDVSTIPSRPHEEMDLPETSISYRDDAVAIDIQYNPASSAWLDLQRDQGLRTDNGLSMLVHQARHQMQWWFNREVPLEPLLRAVGR